MKKEKQAEQAPISKTRRVIKRVTTVVTILIFTMVLACIVSVLTTKYMFHRPAALFGYRIVKILTDSMSPSIPANSYVLVKNIEGKDVKEGDIVVHVPAYGPYTGWTMTHQCIKGPYWDEEKQQTCILTQGTKTGAPIDEPVPIANVQSVYIRTFAKAGGFFDFITSKWGVIVMVALPCLAVVILQIVRMVKAVTDKPDEEKVKQEVQKINEERTAATVREMFGDGNAASAGTGEMGDVMAFIAAEKAKQPTDAGATATKGTGDVDDEVSRVMAFIAGEKAKSAAANGSAAEPPKDDAPKGEMSDVLAFIAAQKAKNKDK